MFHVPEQFRVTKSKEPSMNTTIKDGNNGVFAVKKHHRNPYQKRDKYGNTKNSSKGSFTLFLCVASDGAGWERVSISIVTDKRIPTWDEMCEMKDLFWDKDDVVVQYHPAEKDYINNHSETLHLWRPTGVPMPVPPPEMVGIKSMGTLE